MPIRMVNDAELKAEDVQPKVKGIHICAYIHLSHVNFVRILYIHMKTIELPSFLVSDIQIHRGGQNIVVFSCSRRKRCVKIKLAIILYIYCVLGAFNPLRLFHLFSVFSIINEYFGSLLRIETEVMSTNISIRYLLNQKYFCSYVQFSPARLGMCVWYR